MTKATKKRTGVRLDVPHSAECWYLKRGDAHANFMCLADPPETMRDRAGRRLRPHASGPYWYRFRCNCPQCPAIAIVMPATVADFIGAALSSRSAP